MHSQFPMLCSTQCGFSFRSCCLGIACFYICVLNLEYLKGSYSGSASCEIRYIGYELQSFHRDDHRNFNHVWFQFGKLYFEVVLWISVQSRSWFSILCCKQLRPSQLNQAVIPCCSESLRIAHIQSEMGENTLATTSLHGL